MKNVSLLIMSLMMGSVYSQDQDLGLLIGVNKEEQFQLEFRSSIIEKWSYNMNISYGFDDHLNYENRIIFGSNNTVLDRRFSNKNYFFNLKGGIERQLRSSYFSLRGELGVQYRKEELSYLDYEIKEDDNGEWNDVAVVSSISDNIDNEIKCDYVNPFLMVTGQLNVPLGKSLILNVWLGSQLKLNTVINNNISGKEHVEFFIPNKAYFDLNQSLGLGLRYVFMNKTT